MKKYAEKKKSKSTFNTKIYALDHWTFKLKQLHADIFFKKYIKNNLKLKFLTLFYSLDWLLNLPYIQLSCVVHLWLRQIERQLPKSIPYQKLRSRTHSRWCELNWDFQSNHAVKEFLNYIFENRNKFKLMKFENLQLQPF